MLLKSLPNETSAKDNSASTSSSKVTLFNQKCDVIKAEIIWTLKSVQCNMAASVNEDLKDVFKAMFSGPVAEGFNLGRTKLSYLITEAIGPYFKENFLKDAREAYYSLIFDETVNYADKKELQFKVKYWSEDEKEIVCKHLQTIFLGHATADGVIFNIMNVLQSNSLSVNKLLMLGSDGPNVNKKIWRLVNEQMIEGYNRGLVDIGTCNIHMIHNAFLKGLEEFGEIACELINSLYAFFKKFPSRWEDYQKIQLKNKVKQHRFLKHVSSRWLTAGPASERVLEQWPAIEEYFLKFVPNKEKKLMQTEKYKQIVKYINYTNIKVEISFLCESSQLHCSFTEFFQRSDPLIHLLSSELNNFLKKVCGRICKPSEIDFKKVITNEQLRSPLQTDIGESSTNFLKMLKKSDRISTMCKIQRHYVASHNYVVQKNFLEKTILHYMQCLDPKNILQPRSLDHVVKLSNSLSFIGIDVLQIKDEWRILQTDQQISKTYDRIDHFWRDILYQSSDLGHIRYPSLNKLVKVCLSLSHGNSDVERGFSVSRRILSEEKTAMSERLLNDRLIIKDCLKKYKNVGEVPITRELINLTLNARHSYELYLEEQKKIKQQQLQEDHEKEEMAKQKRLEEEKLNNLKGSVKDLEEKCKSISQEKKEVQKSADTLFKEANERLKQAIQKKDFEGMRIAQGMMEGTQKLREKERTHENKEDKLNRIVNKRKSNLIEAFLNKKQKN